MTNTSPFRQTTLMGWVSTADSYVLFDKPIYSPLLQNKGPQNMIHCFISHKYRKLTARWGLSSYRFTKTPNVDWPENWYQMYKTVTSAIFFFLKKCVCLWAGFTKQGRIISYALPFYLIAKWWGCSPKSTCLLITESALMRFKTTFSWEISPVDSGPRHNMLNYQQDQGWAREHPFWSVQQRICGTWGEGASFLIVPRNACRHVNEEPDLVGRNTQSFFSNISLSVIKFT